MVFSLAMLSALVALKLIEAQGTSVGRDEFRQITVGLCMLAVASLGRLYFGLGAFDYVPFLSHQIFFDLAFWITVISGCTLMVSGVSRWLPLARRQRRLAAERVRRLELLMKIEQMVGVESRLDVVLGLTLDHLMQQLPLRAGAVYTYASATDDFSLLRADGPSPDAVVALNLPEHADSLSALTRRAGQPYHSMLLREDREPVALILVWPRPDQPLSNEDALVLRLVGDVVERQVTMQRNDNRLTVLSARTDLHEDVMRVVSENADHRSGAIAVLKLVARRLGADYAALSLTERDRTRMQRITVGTEGQSLFENNIARPDSQALLGDAFHRGLSVLRSELRSSQKLTSGELSVGLNLRSVLAVPYRSNGGRTVLILGSQAPQAFDVSHQATAESLAPAMMALSTGLAAQGEHEKEQRDAQAFADFAASASCIDTIQDAFDQAAALISSTTAASLVRISVPDQTHEFLESRALLVGDGITPVVPADGRMVLSQMPAHRAVLSEGRPRVSSGTDINGNAEAENRQALFDGVGTSLTIPVMVGSRCWALITMGYQQSAIPNHKLTSAQSFAEAVAGMLSLVIALCVVRRRTFMRPTPQETPTPDPEFKARLRSSLTGILGSVEMLKTRLPEGEDASTERYLSIIDRSARRIDDFVNAGEPSPD